MVQIPLELFIDPNVQSCKFRTSSLQNVSWPWHKCIHLFISKHERIHEGTQKTHRTEQNKTKWNINQSIHPSIHQSINQSITQTTSCKFHQNGSPEHQINPKPPYHPVTYQHPHPLLRKSQDSLQLTTINGVGEGLENHPRLLNVFGFWSLFCTGLKGRKTWKDERLVVYFAEKKLFGNLVGQLKLKRTRCFCSWQEDFPLLKKKR